MVDNNGNIVAPLIVSSINNQDTTLLPEALEKFNDVINSLRLEIAGSFLTLDSGFDSERNRFLIREIGLTPVIKPNFRGLKNQDKIEAINDGFAAVEHVYKERYRIERNFAWQDTYRKLVIRYEKLQCTHLGFKHLAYALVNYRSFFGKNLC
ncbi:MAG: transposase [Candidatus Parcubacteria bacterium]|nr:transposase [Candidatus Parcubacteria bacterium]